jgi:hypothetical protein
MSQSEKKAYYYAIKDRYLKATKKEKSIILKEFCIVCGYNKKYAIRILNKVESGVKNKKARGRKSIYSSIEFITVLKEIWASTDYICSKRLKSAIPLWLPFYEITYGRISDNTRKQLLAISPSTLDRVLKYARLKSRKGLSGTKPGSLLKNHIPIRTDNWDIDRPGFVEADTVAHCGNSIHGDFIWSLTMSDINTGWTENRAVWNKGAKGVVSQIKDIEKSLPFTLLGFDCDNGCEFLNHHLLNYFKNNGNKTSFTRSRPYKKNDNAHVEQKNWTQVRHLFGYDRLDNEELVAPMNDLYANEWSLYNNFFRPSQKLIEKVKINSKYVKRYDIPKTPYTRILESKYVPEEKKEALRNIMKDLNPFELKKQIEYKLKAIFKNISVTSIVRHRI